MTHTETLKRLGKIETDLRGLMQEIHRNREILESLSKLEAKFVSPLPSRQSYKSATTA